MSASYAMSASYIHPTAIIEAGVEIGHDTSIWDNVHIRRNTRIGHHCIVGEKSHISYDVRIGDMVKINAFVYICTAVTLEDGVMISAGCIFTNDRYPRAAEPELMSLRSSDPDEQTLPTLVRAGATIGAGSIIGCNLSIGRFAMVGMGSLVTRPVDEFHLVIGNPARTVGYVCRCGQPFAKFEAGRFPDKLSHSCAVCRRRYTARNGVVSESFAVIAHGR
jgi:UDP-2-acetamido-3-amino-2,3-dideoxy-glucuronate N-acetyltransferase